MMDRDDAHAEASDLRRTCDTIVEELKGVRTASKATTRELQQRNRELAATVAVAQATSTGQLDLHGTLDRALEVVLEVTDLPAGWILLLPQVGSEPVLTSTAGVSQEVARKLADSRPSDCACAKVLESRQPLLVCPLHTDCPIQGLDLGNDRPPNCHATVPLLTRTEVVGVLNLASDSLICLDERKLTLLSAIGRQLGIAVENARLWEGLKQRDRLRSQLLEQAIFAQEEERRRIARELHDQIGQALTSILLWTRALEAQAEGSDQLVVSSARLGALKALVTDILDDVRHLALQLRPSVLDDLGLLAALQRTVRTFKARHQLAIDLQTVGLEGVRLPSSVETALYRIVQEALTNVALHADASRVSLLLEVRAGAATLIVEDDGCGFEVERLMRGPAAQRCLGLYGMRERAELLGGKLTIESVLGTGTTAFVHVPLSDDRGRQDG